MSVLRARMAELVRRLNGSFERLGREVRLMEVCGTHTVNACRSGVHGLMPEGLRLLSGPGCPVCVTPQPYIDVLVELGTRSGSVGVDGREGVTIATYGDMVRVAGEGGSLELARSRGADVRVVTSALDAVEIAESVPEREVVFAAVGFETTAPATAASVLAARERGVENFSVLACHKMVLPAMRALLDDPETRVDGFLCPGHVSVIVGARVFDEIVERYGRPCAIAGFEPLQIMEGVLALVEQLVAMEEGGAPRNENLYPQVVSDAGNLRAQELIRRVFMPGDSAWRALGVIERSGLDLRREYSEFDAFERFDLYLPAEREPKGCRCGEVITGRCEPSECGLFGRVCTPMYPIGPCMVSSEGACQAWFKYRRVRLTSPAGAVGAEVIG